MNRILVMGAGRIGTLITTLLASSEDYTVHLGDIYETNPQAERLSGLKNVKYVELDAGDAKSIAQYIKKENIGALVSSLPYYCNHIIARVAAETKIHYFDLTEDVATTETILEIAKGAKTAFVPQCGLAPGFISIITHHLMSKFTKLDSVKMHVGALPTNISNALQYSLTWSIDGLINEYGNACHGIEDEKMVTLVPLEGLEQIKIDGLTYEAFNTSGGVGSLAKSYEGRLKHLSYKTIRYPGHCEKMKFLMNDLKLNHDRETLRRILENSLPRTYQDVVLIYISVTGTHENQWMEDNYVKKFYPKRVHDHHWSAIQLTTASSICCLLDIVLSNPGKYHGFVRQEEFTLEDITQNRFGTYYA